MLHSDNLDWQEKKKFILFYTSPYVAQCTLFKVLLTITCTINKSLSVVGELKRILHVSYLNYNFP